MKGLVGDLVVTSDEIVDTPETKQINPDDKTNYWLITVVLLTMRCFLSSHHC